MEKPVTNKKYLEAIIYEKLIDPLLEGVRTHISNFVEENNSVIDIACGTGALAFRLSKVKNATVLGVDLARGKIKRANFRKGKLNDLNVQFSKADATSLTEITNQQFDFATMSMLLHSLPENLRFNILKEAIRVSKRLIIADYTTPQPKDFYGFAVKNIERFAGGEHFEGFNTFNESGGLNPLLEKAGLIIVDEQINSSNTVRVVIAEKRESK